MLRGTSKVPFQQTPFEGAPSADERYAVCVPLPLTPLTSASSHTMKASLPPSSRTTGVSVSAAAAITFLPTPVEPTKMTLSAPAGRARQVTPQPLLTRCPRWPGRSNPSLPPSLPSSLPPSNISPFPLTSGHDGVAGLPVPRHDLHQVWGCTGRCQGRGDDAAVVAGGPGGMLRDLQGGEGG